MLSELSLVIWLSGMGAKRRWVVPWIRGMERLLERKG